VISNYPDVNVLINNAGVQLLTDLTKPVNLTRVNSEVETNFIAPIHLSSLFAQHFATKKEAAIINISSGLAFVPLSFMPVYCATKAAIHSLTLSLRLN
ncbi:MAG TPA: SDR family NAD(P)-dependent oxidoreductase, partial [Segetibacter sp.]|nr:SDR family NAD(P)-dependent oxidoreductase [Segetibacter sp.]